jgi:integrase
MTTHDTRFKHLHCYDSRHGTRYVYFRPPNGPSVRLPANVGSHEFLIAYVNALEGKKPLNGPTPQQRRKDDFNTLMKLYYGTPEFKSLRPSTRTNYRRVLEGFCRDHGSRPLLEFERKHAQAILGSMSDRPEAANNLMKRLRRLLNYAVDIGMISTNPMAGIKGYKSNGEGFHTWSEVEIAQYVAKHPPGTKAYLALTLMLYTGQRKSDAVRMGWSDVSNERLSVVQQKTNTRLMIPMTSDLKAAIEELPKDAPVFLVTERGEQFSVAGFGNWMRKRCDEAGLPQCSSHGLRKACAVRLAEAGCTINEIKSITGHKTDGEVARYTQKSDQMRLADNALKKLHQNGETPKSANPLDKVSKQKE